MNIVIVERLRKKALETGKKIDDLNVQAQRGTKLHDGSDSTVSLRLAL